MKARVDSMMRLLLVKDGFSSSRTTPKNIGDRGSGRRNGMPLLLMFRLISRRRGEITMKSLGKLLEPILLISISIDHKFV